MNPRVLRIAITLGEPAGIGPDLVAAIAGDPAPYQRVVIGDGELLAARARQLGLTLSLKPYEPGAPPRAAAAGELHVAHIPLRVPAVAGQLDPANGSYVLQTLERSAAGCLAGEFDAVCTAPVQKSTIVESGTPFSGHTEFFAARCKVEQPVMLLCAGTLRVALLTTHLPLRAVPDAITAQRLHTVCRILSQELDLKFGIVDARIAVLGLNPHAGEAGQLGREELEVIAPTLGVLRKQGLNITGPLPADSAFTPAALQNYDAVLAMYHDQGLPVLKHAGFGNAVNVTLGLPIVRTSVDHGTALSLAGTGAADSSSLQAALAMAQALAERAGR
ncbi:MAG: 4-hydroxythreonine-4-phosphate dehydrogenase PdxA [Gammaproteobacteria bacterium]|jgi:4-hydroxythreonine-4-phosphate dehydrogenase|nr:4-hydroxythreonine-4-phosphate dehydrogenase PdxA [Gammaproteobacteria bacterium]